MKVKCLFEKMDPTIHDKKLVDWANNSELELTVGKVYIVLAIAKSDLWAGLIYFVLGDDRDTFPLSFPTELFEIVDSNISKYWDFHLSHIESLSQIEIGSDDIISFKEWSLEKDFFYEKLLNEDAKEVRIFENYKEKMLSE